MMVGVGGKPVATLIQRGAVCIPHTLVALTQILALLKPVLNPMLILLVDDVPEVFAGNVH
jgi:hypothetical protein